MGRSLARVPLAALLAMTFASAQAAWPERLITLVVPSPAGGPTDVVARLVASPAWRRPWGSRW
jgi:tripartite-type tricarboxylate transporter receptor subunit TctC